MHNPNPNSKLVSIAAGYFALRQTNIHLFCDVFLRELLLALLLLFIFHVFPLLF